MKMKWKSALLAVFFGGITLSSCTDKDEVGPDPVPPVVEEGDAFLSLQVLGGLDVMLPTKATTPGDTDENSVENAMWVLYDPVSLQVKYQFPIEATSTGASGATFSGNGVSSSADRGEFITKAKQVVDQEYKLLVILNYTEDMKKATVEGKYYNAFEDVKTTTVAELSKTGSGGALKSIAMTNASGLVNVKKSHLYTSAADAENKDNAKPLVQVDRILAKVTMAIATIDASELYPNGGRLADAKWKLDITNKKTFWVRRQTYLAPVLSGAANNTNQSTWKHETDGGEYKVRENFYAEDPNWDFISLDRKEAEGGAAGNRDDLKAEFDFEPTGTLPDFSGANELSTTATRNYVLENTMNAAEQWEDVTTRILIRGNFVPAGYKGKTFAENESYYLYGGSAFSFDQIKTWYNDMDNDNKEHPWPTAPAGLKDMIVKAVDAGRFGPKNAIVEWTASGSFEGLSYYKNGISYYSALIRHFDDKLSSNEGAAVGVMNFGRYGVVRNNVYQVTLTKITGPGTPTIPDPEGPDDKDKKYLSTEIEVLPWVIREQNINI